MHMVSTFLFFHRNINFAFLKIRRGTFKWDLISVIRKTLNVENAVKKALSLSAANF